MGRRGARNWYRLVAYGLAGAVMMALVTLLPLIGLWLALAIALAAGGGLGLLLRKVEAMESHGAATLERMREGGDDRA